MSATRAQIRQSIARSARQTALIANAAPEQALRAQFASAFKADAPFNLIFPRGTWHGANLAAIGGSIVIDDAFLSEVVANWRDAGSPPLPIRKTHQHLDKDITPLERLELEKSYGFLTDMRITADGLEVKTVMTAAGKAEIDSGAWAFWSPEWFPRHRDRRTGDMKGQWLAGVALTNSPFFDSMPPVAASADADSTDPTTTKEHQMNPEQLKKWALSLGLSADATVEQCAAASQSALTASEAKLKTSESKVTSLTASAITPEVITAAVKPVQDQVEALTASLKAEQAKGLERDVDALIATAKRGDGKTGRAITEPLVLVAKNIAKNESLTAADAFLKALPLSVPIQATGQPGTTDGPLTASAAQKKIAARADELRKAGDTNATVTAMREMPAEALIAEGRPPVSTSSN